MNPPWSDLTFVCDPGIGQTITTLHPVLSIAFFARLPDYAAIRQLYDTAMGLMQDQLTHYHAENMKRPAKITPRAFTMIPAWLSKPKDTHVYSWRANGGADLGCAPPGFDLWMLAAKRPDEALQKVISENLRKWPEGERKNLGTGSILRLVLPIDHPLGEGDVLVDWLMSLELLQRGEFALGECGYGLSSMAGHFGGETQRREEAACSRYPGLDCFRHAHLKGLYRVDHRYPVLVPSVKRAAWTTILHDLTVSFLGGADSIRQQFADTSEIRVIPLEHGLILQAGPRPQLGDLSRGDILPLLRKMAKVLRPARATHLAEESDFWNHFFNIFETDYA